MYEFSIPSFRKGLICLWAMENSGILKVQIDYDQFEGMMIHSSFAQMLNVFPEMFEDFC